MLSRNTLVLLAVSLMLGSLVMISQEISESTVMLFEESMETKMDLRRLQERTRSTETWRTVLIVFAIIFGVGLFCFCLCCGKECLKD